MSLLAHLDELRRRLVHVAVGIAIAFGACYWQSDRILDWCIAPYREVAGEGLSVISVAEGFFVALRVSFLAALFLSAPWTLLQVWLFVRPALYPRERRLAVPFVVATSVAFVAGGAFAYYAGWPAILRYLIGTASKGFELDIRAEGYMATLGRVLVGMGLVFEAPVLSFFLARIGILRAATLVRYARHAVVGIAILAALITPSGDIPSMVTFALPMLGLYALSIGVTRLAERDRGRDGAAP
jgi:sec-independent protein translocase protein TatC